MNNLASLTGRNLDQYTPHLWKARVLLYFIEVYIIFTQQYLVRQEHSYFRKVCSYIFSIVIVDLKS